MEDGEPSVSRRASSSARRPRTDVSRRRPHSQPERLLTVSCRNSSESGKIKDVDKAMDGADDGSKPSEEKSVRVFKRREIGSRGGAVAENGEKSKFGNKTAKTNGKSKAGGEKSAPRTKNKQPPEEKQPEAKRRRQRLVLEGSDDSEQSEKNGSKDSFGTVKKVESKAVSKPVAENVGLRKSSRIVKRRTFDDEIDYEEVTKRRRKPQLDSAKEVLKQVEENADSADEELPRKKPRKGSMQEIHASSEKPSTPRQRGGNSQECTGSKEKPLTARQRAMQAKECVTQEQASTSGRDEAQKADSPSDNSIDSKEKATVPLTARQRSLQACKDGDGHFGLIEFPDGLNHTDRRRKAKLTDEEKLAKKVEAASKRKQQVEKAAKEIQASAIQKILNQDSNRKKREEKLQKQKQELAEERKAAELELATNTVRWVMGPSGTTVSWAQNEFPLIFSSGPIRYPPPREKCAACDNAYKYRDSKSKLPLCSLQCYKAMQQPLKPALVEISPAQ